MQTSRGRDLALALKANETARLRAEAEQLVLVTELALEYRVTETDALDYATDDVLVRLGSQGTPAVSEFLALELAAILKKSPRATAGFLAQALNLRWRHPRLWAKVQALELPRNRALKAASRCKDLPVELADDVTERWCRRQHTLGWEAAFTHLDELAISADPEAASKAERLAETDRRVTAWELIDGNVAVTAVMEAIDAHLVDATCTELAGILAEQGIHGTQSQLRAKALGLLATPALALRLQQQALQPAMVTAEVNPATGRLGFTDHLAQLDAALAGNIGSFADYLTLPDNHVHPEPPLAPLDGPEPGTLDHLYTDPTRWTTTATASAGASGDGCFGSVCGTLTVPPSRLQPKVKVVVHVNAADLFVHADGERQGAAYIEHVGAITLTAMRRMLDGKQVTLQPVIDLNDFPAHDTYRPPQRLTDAIRYLFPRDTFPYATMQATSCDLDHTVAYTPARGPGQTRIGNLAPINRTAHRAKTRGHWRVHQPNPGRLIWTSPLGFRYEVTPHGTEQFPDHLHLSNTS